MWIELPEYEIHEAQHMQGCHAGDPTFRRVHRQVHGPWPGFADLGS
jgi:hypothetical protein